MRAKRWWQTFFTYLWVFNTGRGLAVCVRLPHNVGLLYDLGSSEEFSPTGFIAEHIKPHLRRFDDCPMAQVVLSHPHADHIAEVSAIAEKECQCYPKLLTCPHDKEPDEGPDERVDFTRVNNPDSAADLIEEYRDVFKPRHLPLQTIASESDYHVPNVEYGIYYLRPPECDKLHPKDDQAYSNALSLVLYIRHGHQSVLIPGDITPEAMERILDGGKGVEKRCTYFGDLPEGMPNDINLRTSKQRDLRDLLSENGLTLLVAPHHGLESGFCQALFDCMKDGKPALNIISEKRHLEDSDGTVHASYQTENGANGVKVDIEGTAEDRFCVSTRDGHHILVVLRGTQPRPEVRLRKDAEELLL